jgi:hypothetical protein
MNKWIVDGFVDGWMDGWMDRTNENVDLWSLFNTSWDQELII